MLIDGIHVPLPSTFYRDGASYLRKLEHNVHRYSLTPAAGLIAFGPGGEGPSLSDAEIKESLKIVAGTASDEKVLIAGIQQDSVRGALAVAEEAASAGFDALLLSAPAGWASLRCRAEILVYYRAIADAASLPVLLSSDPVAPACELSVEEIAGFSAHHNILGLYDSGLSLARYQAIAAATSSVRRDVAVTTIFAPVTGRMMAPDVIADTNFVSADLINAFSPAMTTAMPQPAIKMRSKTVGFQVMAAGAATDLLPLLQAGVAGALPRLSACAPQACHEVYAAFKDGNPGLAAEKAQRLAAADALLSELGVAGVKYACDLNGYFGGFPRLPRLPLDGADRQRVDSVMAQLRN